MSIFSSIASSLIGSAVSAIFGNTSSTRTQTPQNVTINQGTSRSLLAAPEAPFSEGSKQSVAKFTPDLSGTSTGGREQVANTVPALKAVTGPMPETLRWGSLFDYARQKAKSTKGS